MYNDFTCIILSGGKSSRLATNKSLLKIGGKTIVQIIFEKMSKFFEDIIIISNEPELYQFLDTKFYKDIYPGKGPISGIHSGLVNSITEKNFFISCDMPFVKRELIDYLINFETEKDIVIPQNKEYVQTLCGIYGKKCVSIIEKKICNKNDNLNQSITNQSEFSLIRLAMECGAEIVDVSQLPFYNDNMFLNINDYEEFERVKNLILQNGTNLI